MVCDKAPAAAGSMMAGPQGWLRDASASLLALTARVPNTSHHSQTP